MLRKRCDRPVFEREDVETDRQEKGDDVEDEFEVLVVHFVVEPVSFTQQRHAHSAQDNIQVDSEIE